MLPAGKEMQIESFLLPWQRRGDITGCGSNLKLGFTFSRLKKKGGFVEAAAPRSSVPAAAAGPNKRRLSRRTFSQGGRRGRGFCRSAPGGGDGGGHRDENSSGFLFGLRGGRHSSRFRVPHTITWAQAELLKQHTTAGSGGNACLARARVHEVESELVVEPVQGFCWLCLVFQPLSV